MQTYDYLNAVAMTNHPMGTQLFEYVICRNLAGIYQRYS